MKILLTGAAGFVGSHLVARLLADGHTVVGLDNLCTGRAQNLTDFSAHPAFQFIKHDVTNAYPATVTQQKFDWVMHFASPASPPKYFKMPLATMQVNSLGTEIALNFCRKTGASFFYASTSEVYGDPIEHPQKESYWGNVNPIGVRSIYDEAKRYGEAMTYLYAREYGVSVRVIRIFNTYGPKMDPEDGRVVTNLMYQAIRGEPMTIYGDGKQTRSFQFISDLIEGVVRLMKSSYTQPVNLGNPDEFTILDFAKEVQKLTGSKSALTFAPLPSDDPKQRKPDITVASRELGWLPRVSLQEGLKLTLQAFQSG